VVQRANEIKVALGDERTVFDAKIVGTDPQTDMAVIKVEAQKLPAMTFTNSDQLEVGDVVLAVGDPFGVGQTVTMGIVSAKDRGPGLELWTTKISFRPMPPLIPATLGSTRRYRWPASRNQHSDLEPDRRQPRYRIRGAREPRPLHHGTYYL
jgi:hypothetical protein